MQMLAISARFLKRCLNRKQGDSRQRKKEETKGSQTALSTMFDISLNKGAVPFPSASYGCF